MSPRSWFLVVGIIVLTGVALWYFTKREKITNDPPKGHTIIAFGDSLTYGVGASPGNDYVSVLSQRIGAPIINAGRSGDTTREALGRLEEDVLARDPKVVIVLLGGNDVLRQVPVEETVQNLETIIDRIHGTGAAVILVGIRGGLFRGAFREVFAQLAKEKHTAYVPDILDDVWNDRHKMSDPIHPNDEGYRIMAERLAPVLQRLLET